MAKSLQLGSIAGIRVQVHWTFLLIIGWVILTSVLSGMSPLGTAMNVAFILVLFGCVLLHELGHALAARLFGIPTRDITLLPIGGVARLERMPRKPYQELVVALAGPAVNVVIAAGLLAILLPTVGPGGLAAVPLRSGGFLQQLLIVNVMLVAFNMLPAFPLDGGRVFRALLAMVFSYATATRVAAVVGQICAIGFGLLGLANPFMLIIAAFIFFSAGTEAQQVAIRERFGGFRVRDGMLRSFRAVAANASIQDLADELLSGTQRDYPVVNEGVLVGMLRRSDLLEALQREDDQLVADVMDRDVRPVEESDGLMSALERAAPRSGSTVPVTDAGALTGLLDLQQVFDVARARARLRKATSYVSDFTKPQQPVTAT